MIKKLAVCVMLVAMIVSLGGCAPVTSFLCSPTASQTQAAQVGVALAQAALTALAVFTGNLEAQALSSVAIPVFQAVVNGYCTTNAQWQSAVNALTQAQTQPAVAAATAKAVTPGTSVTAQIAYLQSVKWSK